MTAERLLHALADGRTHSGEELARAIRRQLFAFADEQMGFAERDAVAVELSRARHDEQRVAILFDLRPLVGVVRILNGEIVQLELPLHTG